MVVGFVIPAHGRFAVTQLACFGMAWLAERLAVRGIAARVVVVANDRNLKTACKHGFDAMKGPNVLGAKINAGITHVRSQGADWVCFTGSDDWLHPDLFDTLDGSGTAITAGRSISIIDLPRAAMRTLQVNSRVGTGPWLIPAELLPAEPCEPLKMRGIEGTISRRLIGNPPFVFADPHPLARVDFKTAENMSSYRQLQFLGYGPERNAWDALDEHYPAWLVDRARETSEELAAGAA